MTDPETRCPNAVPPMCAERCVLTKGHDGPCKPMHDILKEVRRQVEAMTKEEVRAELDKLQQMKAEMKKERKVNCDEAT